MSRSSRWRTPAFLGVLFDWLWVFIAPVLAFGVMQHLVLVSATIGEIAVYALASGLAVGMVFALFRVQNRLWMYTSLVDVAIIAAAAAVGILLTSFLFPLFYPEAKLPRALLLLHFLTLSVPMIGLRVLVRGLRNSKIFAGRLSGEPGQRETNVQSLHHVVVVGANGAAELYLRAVSELGNQTVDVVGIVDEDPSKYGHQIRSHEILGSPKDLPSLLAEFDVRGIRVDEIMVCCDWDELSKYSRLVLKSIESDYGLEISLLYNCFCIINGRKSRERNYPSIFNPSGQSHVEIIEGKNFEDADLSPYFRYKSAVDLSIAMIMVIVLSPVIAVAGLIVATNVGRPLLFWQKRPGYLGRVFKVYKFRTMRCPCDADGKRVPDDKRQTRVTRLIRRWRLDELPQLYNVLKGDMALIGPRPLLPVDQPWREPLRQMIRPGLTGWAQVNGGKLLGPREKVALDLWYARNASVWLDLRILWKSLVVVLGGDKINQQAVIEAAVALDAQRESLDIIRQPGQDDDARPIEVEDTLPIQQRA